MNGLAQAVGAADTTFLNPHGMDQDGHASTARDVALITAHAMAHPVFRDVAGTRVHAPPPPPRQQLSPCGRATASNLPPRGRGAPYPARVRNRLSDSLGGGDERLEDCALSSPSAQPSRLRWANTNRLLSLRPGCLGVKTGLTREAGACLCTALRPPRPAAASAEKPTCAREPLLVVVLGCDSVAERHSGALRVARWAGVHASGPGTRPSRPVLASAPQTRAATPRLAVV